jgi:nitroimidazol reductase NimA-like FMN-containing flavoprotein (pyridoxamine 5'-phosphate oxidase superfamily)
MKTHALTAEQVDELFARAPVGRIVTQNPDGFPYAVPIHFIYDQGKIYTHGLPNGQKIDNIKQNSKVCFEVDEMIRVICDDIQIACDANTEFTSIIALGHAKLIEDLDFKREVLNKVVDKYTPNFSGSTLPENMVKGTAVIEIDITECTGKYYK